MPFFKTLATKPWLATSVEQQTVNLSEQAIQDLPAKTALKFFLSVVTVIFFLFTVTFLQRSQAFDFQALSGESWLPFNDLTPLWENTSYLLAAGLCLILSIQQAKKNRSNWLTVSLGATTVFTVLFIWGQLNIWQYLNHAGFYIYSNPANSYYFLLTGVHGLHIIGGMFALARVIFMFARNTSYRQLQHSLKLCALYWHYLFFIWLFLFFLLTSSASTFKAIALLCGFAT